MRAAIERGPGGDRTQKNSRSSSPVEAISTQVLRPTKISVSGAKA